MRSSFGLLWGLPIALSSISCSKSDSDKFADNYCAEVAKCCHQSALPSDGKACHELMDLLAVGEPYNSQAGDACMTEVRSQVSAGIFCIGLNLSLSTTCHAAFGSYNKMPGEDCTLPSDCAPSSIGQVRCASLNVGDNVISKCLVQVPGKAGDTPCIGTQEGNVFLSHVPSIPTDVLSQGYICNIAEGMTCRDGACITPASVGENCLFSTDCVRTAYCNKSQHLCTPKINAGGDCTGTDDSECVDSAYCDTDAKQCKAQLANGATCTRSDVCQIGYCFNGKCQDNASSLSSICGS
jgi:hypothetical protein